MDVSDASYYIINEKKKNKGSQMGHTKKKKKKKIIKRLICLETSNYVIQVCKAMKTYTLNL
jgi:hypothetical protein